MARCAVKVIPKKIRNGTDSAKPQKYPHILTHDEWIAKGGNYIDYILYCLHHCITPEMLSEEKALDLRTNPEDWGLGREG